MQSAEKESVELNEKHHEVVKRCDEYVTKIKSMEEKIDFLEKEIINKEKEYSHVGVQLTTLYLLYLDKTNFIDRISLK